MRQFHAIPTQHIRADAGLSAVAFAVAAVPGKRLLTPRSVSPSAARTPRAGTMPACFTGIALRHRAHS